MSQFITKISLYDILTMIIPGGTIILFLQYLFASLPFPINAISTFLQSLWSWQNCLVVLVLSYMIGLANHLLACQVWKKLRNDPKMIKGKLFEVISNMPLSFYLKYLFYSEENEQEVLQGQIKEIASTSLWLIFAVWFVSQLFVLTSEMLFSKDVELLLCEIDIVLVIVLCLMTLAIPLFYTKTEDKTLLDAYYEAYYYVQQNSERSNIPVIESQVAFLQSMLLPLLLMLCLPTYSVEKMFSLELGTNANYIVFMIKVFWVSLCVSIIPIVIYRQNKIYELVWYDYEYLKRLEK